MCIKASGQLMPAARYAKKQATQPTKYTTHSPRAVSAMRGVSLASFIGPVISVLNNCAPPTPSSGRMATASTMMPRPPTSCRKHRHTFTDSGSSSSPVSTVAPVALKPDIASK